MPKLAMYLIMDTKKTHVRKRYNYVLKFVNYFRLKNQHKRAGGGGACDQVMTPWPSPSKIHINS